MGKPLDRVAHNCATTGNGATLTLGSVLNAKWRTITGAGGTDGDTVSIIIEDQGTNKAEIASAVIGGSGTTLTRTTIWSSDGLGVSLTLSGNSVIYVAPNKADLPASKLQITFVSGTSYFPPDGAVMLECLLYGGGGGGGGGGRQATTSARGGGGGGAGGGFARVKLDVAGLGGVLVCQVGGGGSGGPARLADNGSGGTATAGTPSYVLANTQYYYAFGGQQGGPGSTTAGTSSNAQFQGVSQVSGQNGGAGSIAGNAAAIGIQMNQCGGGGGGGGQAASVTTTGAGGRGGGFNQSATSGSAGTNRASSNGANIFEGAFGNGGTGGAYTTGAVGGDGGNGGLYGGGGGGGGAADNGFNSGKGGDGGSGAVIIIAYF